MLDGSCLDDGDVFVKAAKRADECLLVRAHVGRAPDKLGVVNLGDLGRLGHENLPATEGVELVVARDSGALGDVRADPGKDLLDRQGTTCLAEPLDD